MNEDEFVDRSRGTGGAGRAALSPTSRVQNARAMGHPGSYTAKDFQLEVLGQLAEVQELAESLRDSLTTEATRHEERNRLLRFDGRTLVAMGAIALSLTGYVLQDARNSSRRDAEIETTKARVASLEKIAATNTEGRIKTEVELEELRHGQEEIKAMIAAHDLATKKTSPEK